MVCWAPTTSASAAPPPSPATTAGTAKTVTVTGLSLSGTDAGNYQLAATSASTTADITPAALTVTANDASKPVNTPNPQFTASYAGFVGGETPAVLNGTLAFSTPAIVASPAGLIRSPPMGRRRAITGFLIWMAC